MLTSALATFLRRVLLASVLFAVTLTMAFAQGAQVDADGRPDYETWSTIADRAEDVLNNGSAPTDSLETLRSNLASWRDAFIARQSANAARIETLRAQISTLGEPPAEGIEEPDEIAARRTELETRLAEQRVPVLRAEEAATRASGLIGEVDTLVRERQADRSLRLDPSPLNPVNWPVATEALGNIFVHVRREFSANLNSDIRVKSLQDNLPITLVLLVIGLVLVSRSTAWVEYGVGELRKRTGDGRASVRVGAFIASAFAVILPLLGLMLLIQAPQQSEFLGPISSALFDLLAVWVGIFFAARWLGREVFPKAYPPSPIIALAPKHLSEGRFYTMALGALVGFDLTGRALAETPLIGTGWDAAVLPVLRFPVLVLAGLMLFRLGQLMLLPPPPSGLAEDETDADATPDATDLEEPPSRLVTTFLARISMVIGIAAPLMVAVGYVVAGGQILTSTVLTLALLALVAVLQRFFRDVYALFLGEDRSGTALVPVLVGFALVLAAVPALTLIWGARVADLRDVWGYITTGFSIGETRISLSDVMLFLVIFLLGYGLTRLLQRTLNTQVLPKTKLDTGGRNAVVAGTGYVGIFLAAILAITGAGIDLSSLAIVAGALSVGIGFGLQTIVSNFVSGIILLIERPISEGDWIEVGSTMGVVKQISVRATTIETFDRTDVIVPNADLIAGSVTNWTKGNLTGRLILPVGVAYGSDTQKVSQILQEIAEAHPVVILVPPPNVLFMNFGADALEFEIRLILRDINYVMVARSEINHEIARRFAEEGIEIPFSQRDVWLRNPEVLGPKTTAAPEPGTG